MDNMAQGASQGAQYEQAVQLIMRQRGLSRDQAVTLLNAIGTGQQQGPTQQLPNGQPAGPAGPDFWARVKNYFLGSGDVGRRLYVDRNPEQPQ
jgi:hypothetical protein